MLFQKRVVGTKFDVYVFSISISAPSNYKTDEGIDLICGCNSCIYIFVSKYCEATLIGGVGTAYPVGTLEITPVLWRGSCCLIFLYGVL